MTLPPAMTVPSEALQRLQGVIGALRSTDDIVRISGRVVLAAPTHYQVSGLSRHVRLGDLVEAGTLETPALGQVVRIEPDHVTVKLFDNDARAMLGDRVTCRGPLKLSPSSTWKGRVLDALARPIDNLGPLISSRFEARLASKPLSALMRHTCGEAVVTGVRAVDIFTPFCLGQRMGIFAGSGVGKSTLLGMLAKSPGFDCSVIALVGERSREVREFVETILGDALMRSVVVVATGDESPMMRCEAPRTAMSIAEHLRDCGEKVLLVVDSVTRFAHALREVSLAAGEPPVVRGYTPSVLSDLPRLLERAGPGMVGSGSITGLFSVLVDGDDHNEIVSDTVRGILDGHIVLDREIAARGRYPAIDILNSVSRLADRVWSGDQRETVAQLKSYMAEFEQTRDLRLLGGYKPGANAELDKIVQLVPRLYKFLTQSETHSGEVAVSALREHLQLTSPPEGSRGVK